MKAMLLALALVLVAPAALADGGGGRGHRPKRETIVVRDHTGPVWDGVIRETVKDFNRVMPEGGPRLRYQRREPIFCTQAITACSGQLQAGFRGFAGWEDEPRGHGQIWLSDDGSLTSDRTQMHQIACHELMHILGRIGDNYGAKPNTSCVWGALDDPGRFDVQRLEQVWGGKGGKHPKKRH